MADFKARQGTTTPSLSNLTETDQAGGTSNHDADARVAAVASLLRRAISSTTDVTYAASVKLLSFPSRLERAPSNPASKSDTPSRASADAARPLWAATDTAISSPRAHRRITSSGTSAEARRANWIAACRSERSTSLACGMLRAAEG